MSAPEPSHILEVYLKIQKWNGSETNIIEDANRVNLDGAAHYEPPHVDLLFFSLRSPGSLVD